MTANRVSTYTTGSGDAEGRNGEQKKEIWLSLLDAVSSGKRLPEKNLIVLGMDALGLHHAILCR